MRWYPSSRRSLIGAAAVLAIAGAGMAFAAPPSGTGNPQYTSGPTNEGVTVQQGQFRDIISGSVQGVGNNNLTFLGQADAVALYACQNNGGNFPTDPKKQSKAAKVEAETNVQADNGHASFAVALLAPASALNCPGSQHPVPVCAQFSKKRVTVFVGATIVIPETAASPATQSLILFPQFTDACNAIFAP